MREEDLVPLAEQVVKTLAAKGMKLSVAESCTGGLVAHLITCVPGSSNVFVWAAVTYSNEAKINVLGVPDQLLKSHGAVSGPVVEAMAVGVRDTCPAGLGLAISGIAGPGGGSPAKPVGTVWFGLAGADGVTSEMISFKGNRREIKLQAARHALEKILTELEVEPW